MRPIHTFLAVLSATSCAALLAGCTTARPDARAAVRPLPAADGALASAISAAIHDYRTSPMVSGRHEGNPTVCLALRSPDGRELVEPGAELLAEIASTVRVVRNAKCPRTYDTGVIVVTPGGGPVSSPPRPAGYADPLRVEVSEQRYFISDSARLSMQVGQGTWTTYYTCLALPTSGRWASRCTRLSTAVF